MLTGALGTGGVCTPQRSPGARCAPRPWYCCTPGPAATATGLRRACVWLTPTPGTAALSSADTPPPGCPAGGGSVGHPTPFPACRELPSFAPAED